MVLRDPSARVTCSQYLFTSRAAARKDTRLRINQADDGYRQVGRARDDGIGSREAQREGYPAIHAAPQHGSLGAHVEI